MDVTKVKVGQRVSYRAKATSGTGKVTRVYVTEGNSTYVVVHDADNERYVTVRPSQIERV